MAPAPPSRFAAGEGDTFVDNNGPHWTAKLPPRIKHDWGLCGGSTPGAPVLPPRSANRPRRALPRSPWHPDLSSESNPRTHPPPQNHQQLRPHHHDSAQDHDHTLCHTHPHDQGHPHGQDHSRRDTHPHGHDHHPSQDHPHSPQYPHHASSKSQSRPSSPENSPPEYSQPPPNSPPPPYNEAHTFGDQLPQIANEATVDLSRVNIVSPDTELWASDKEESRAVKALFDEFLDKYLEAPVEEPVDPAVERAVDIPPHLAITSEHSSPYSPPSVFADGPSANPNKGARKRPHGNKYTRKKAARRRLPTMGQGSSSFPAPSEGSSSHPAPAEGSTGIATPTSVAETTIMASDVDKVRSPRSSPSSLPTQGMTTPLPAAVGPANQAPPKKKKRKGNKGKKGKPKAGQAGGNIPGPSSDAQLTDSVSPALEPVVSLVGATSEVETPAGIVSAGQDGSPTSEAPSPTVVNCGGEATTELSAAKEYTGPCIVDTERWRQRVLARMAEEEAIAKQEAEARREANLHAATPYVGGVFPHSVYQSENSWAQWPMEGQSVPAQYSHGGGDQTGYAQPMSGAVAGAPGVGSMCGFYPTCYHHHDQGGLRRSCCCYHGSADCWFFAPAPAGPIASQDLMSAAAPLVEARRESQMSSPKSSSLGEPVSEPIVESLASLDAVSRQSPRVSSPPSEPVADCPAASTEKDVPAINVISTPANSKQMSLCQAHPGGVPTPEDLVSPSLYFDAPSKNSPSALASNESKRASRDTSRGPETTQTGHLDETRSQGCQSVPASTRHQSSQTEAAVGPLAFQMEHVQALFGNPEFADIQLLLGPDPSHPLIVYNLHKAIIAGSPFLYSVMAAKRHRDGYVDHIRAFTGVSFTCSHAFTMALQTMYGTPLVTLETLRRSTLQGLGPPDDFGTGTYSFSIERAMVDFALCYAAAGAFLARREITERGIDMAISHLSWETAEVILNFGMTPLTYMVTCPDVPFSPMSPAISPASSISGSHGPSTPAVGIDHFHDFHYVQAERASTAALHFITNSITPDFQLYRRAQARYTPSRIPSALFTLPGSLLSNPRLEEIRFGSMPSFADLRPTDPAILVPSAMLITLPYRVFMMALEIMKSRGNLSPELMNEIVEERESHRLMALRVSMRVAPWEIDPEAHVELEYREFVKMEPTDHIGDNTTRVLRATVDRVWVGNDVPNSSLVGPFGSNGPSRTPSFGPGPSTPSNAA